MLGPRGVPRGPRLIAALQAQAPKATPRAPDREARDGVMGQGVGAVAGVVVPVHMVNEAPHVCAQGTHHARPSLRGGDAEEGSSPGACTGCGGD
jgi:hypothetical protein